MSNFSKRWNRIKQIIVPPGSDIQIGAFNILALCGIVVSLITAFYNLAVGFGILSFLECISGVFISVALMLYTQKTGNYRVAMILTVVVIFLGLFTFLFITNGGYNGGVPFFFVFAVVFTAFLLNGATMVFLVVVELVWYTFLCIYTYVYPPDSLLNTDYKARMMDVIVCCSIVSISLAITMYCQIRVYRKKQAELNYAIQIAREANQAKSDFLAKMSHDIRTPLNTIMAMNEMIVANTSSAKIREWVNDSNVSGRILLSLIDDMLDLTRIEAGRMNLLQQPWDTRHVFGEIAKMWKPQAEKAGIEFIYSFDTGMPGYLVGDEDVIRKIANNLMSNAIKYTRIGRVGLSVSRSGEDHIRITVTDTGIGIAPEHLETIFKPFERGAQEIYRETSGSGLGLAIVKELVDAVDGSIDCHSVLNEGTVFTVIIPQKEYNEKIIGGSQSETPDNSQDVQNKGQFIAPDARILVVDDNSFNRKVIKEFLEPALIQTDDVESGYEALEMIDIKDYDLVLMDLRMPKMDGAETLDRIKKEYPDFDTPVVVLTADIMNGVEDRLLKRGFAGFLSKPVSSSKLFDVISEFIPDKVVSLITETDNLLTLAKVESYQDMLLPYGIDLKLALEYNAGNTSEFMMRADLFEEFADSEINRLYEEVPKDSYYLQVHSVKSIAKGVGAFLLAHMAEAAELRHDEEFSKEINPILINEYSRVREGLKHFKEEVSI
ncbi:MAG: response regulator [Lachnospiraceae bacterium]|nr:response regulator [Lachnospiraceae bacterium]